MENELDDLHQLSGAIFSNISCITPHLRTLVANAKVYQKSYQATIVTANQFIESINALAEMAVSAKGATRFIGETLSDIKNMFGEIEAMKNDLMKMFISEVIIPLESKAEQEINMSKMALKQYLQDNKIQTEVVNKATHEIVKLRKKSQRKKSRPGKYEAREEEMLNDLLNSEKKLLNLRQQGLRRALIGERRIFCFIGERLCTYGRGLSVYNGRISSMLEQLTSEWDKVISRPSELPTESEEVISHPSTYNTATIKRKNKYTTIDYRTANQQPNASKSQEETANAPPEHPSSAPTPVPVLANGDAKATVPVSNQVEPSLGKEEVVGSGPQVLIKKALTSDARFSMVEGSPSLRVRQVAANGKKQLIALYDHAAKDPSQLSFTTGDILKPISEETSGWQYGENTKTAKTGWYPAAYAEIISSTSRNPELQNIPGEKARSPPKEGKTRRVSTPAQSGSPYIPAPDYETDESDGRTPSTKNQNGVSPLNSSLYSIPPTASPPTIKINGIAETNNKKNATPSPLMPLAAMTKSNEEPDPEDPDVSPAMPFPPPPPDFDMEENNDIDNVDKIGALVAESPFASVKLKKTVTNDRSHPRIST